MFRLGPLRITAAILAALGPWLSGCAPARTSPLYPAAGASEAAAAAIAPPAGPGGGWDTALRFQIIYVIHGDGGYVWYDDAGRRHEADRDALAQARETAENAPAAEVFIFHQRPARFLRFFRGSDGTLWHYRRGRLLRTIPYSRTREYARPARPGGEAPDALAPEAALFSRFAAMPAPRRCDPPAAGSRMAGPARVFCYFGHGLPVTGKVPYFRSRPDIPFSISAFARDLVRFGGPACPPAKPFALIVLSACHGGTPEATLALSPYADWILASPGDLHLSYLDTRALARLARENPVPFDAGQAGLWGRAIARESFARLDGSVRTGVTLSLYETEKAAAYLREHRGAWAESPEARAEDPFAAGPALLAEPAAYRDCGENPAFGEGGEAAGATLFHRPPRFGINRGKSGHSGWECPEIEPRRASVP